jgi:hypothetical protein
MSADDSFSCSVLQSYVTGEVFERRCTWHVDWSSLVAILLGAVEYIAAGSLGRVKELSVQTSDFRACTSPWIRADQLVASSFEMKVTSDVNWWWRLF